MARYLLQDNAPGRIRMMIALSSLTRLFTIGLLLSTGAAGLASVAACAAQPAPTTQNKKNTSGDDDDDNSKNQQQQQPAAQTPAAPPAAPAATPPATTNPTITSVSPSSVPVGAPPSGLTLTLTGTNFAAGLQVAVGNEMVAATVQSPTSLTFIAPADKLAVAGTVPLAVVSGPASTSSTTPATPSTSQLRSNEVMLTVGGATSTSGALTSLNPSFAPQTRDGNGSMVLTVTGSAFDPTSVIVFNGTDIPTILVDTSTLRGNLPNALLFNPGQVNVAVRRAAILTAPLPFLIGGSGPSQTCQMTCDQLGLFPGQCTNVGGINIGFGPIDFGGLFGQDVQCGFDGCVQNGCNN
jgi:hypothetical protein